MKTLKVIVCNRQKNETRIYENIVEIKPTSYCILLTDNEDFIYHILYDSITQSDVIILQNK